MLLVHWCGLATLAYEFLDRLVAGPSTCLASWKDMLFWNFILRIYFSVFHLGQILLYVGWSPSQFAHFVSFSYSWSSWPGCPHFAHFSSFLQNPLLWPLNHHWGFDIYTFVFRMRKPTLYFLENFLAIYCQNIGICRYQPFIIFPPLQSVHFCNSLVIIILSGCLLHSCLPFPSTRPHIWSSSVFCEV